MKRQTPPLDAIEAFLIASRSSSFRTAAEKLALSPSAFSRRVQALEAFVGVPLFDRDGRRVALTESGRRYLAEIEPAIDAVRRVTVNLRADHVSGPLRIMTPQSFAIAWLLPRLAKFIAHNREIDPMISVGRDTAHLRKGNVDLAIVVRASDHCDALSERLSEIECTVVSALTMAHGVAPPDRIEDLAHFPLLSVHKPEHMWSIWTRRVGHSLPADIEITKFTAAFMVYEAAAAGLGLALGSSLIIDRFLADGRLKALFGLRAPIGSAYFLEYADETVRRRTDVRLFAAWLKEEVTKSVVNVSERIDRAAFKNVAQ